MQISCWSNRILLRSTWNMYMDQLLQRQTTNTLIECDTRKQHRYVSTTNDSIDQSSSSTESMNTTTNNNNNTKQPFSRMPNPTWSIQSLKLHENHTPISKQELHILGKRAMIHINTMTDKQQTQLCQDIGNMINMMEQVQNNIEIQNTTFNPQQLYDVPRGIYEAPLRYDDNDNNINDTSTTTTNSMSLDQRQRQEEDDATTKYQNELQVSQSVRTNYLQHKMKRIGGHEYYEIITSITKKS